MSKNTRPTPTPPLLERLGVRYIRRLSAATSATRRALVAPALSIEQRQEMRQIERFAIGRSSAAGAVSAIVCAGAQVAAPTLLGAASESVSGWIFIGAVTAVASVLEIAFVYWDSLRSVHRLAHVAGLDLAPNEDETTGSEVASALARAALELPNSSTELFGVNPRRESSKAQLLAASLVYKAKVSVSNFLLKVLVRRIVGRALVRAWLPFVAVPVTAAWNGVVSWLVLREARIRAMGPGAVEAMVKEIFANETSLTKEGKRATLRAVATSIVRARDMHPNLVLLLTDVVRRVGESDTHAIDDPAEFLGCLHDLAPHEQAVALQLLSVAAFLDGRLSGLELKLIAEARAACGLSVDVTTTLRMRDAFYAGDPLDPALLAAAGV